MGGYKEIQWGVEEDDDLTVGEGAGPIDCFSLPSVPGDVSRRCTLPVFFKGIARQSPFQLRTPLSFHATYKIA